MLEQPVAIIECKTDLGWNRKRWKAEFEKRAEYFSGLLPGCESFLCLLTKLNFDYSEFESSPHFGKRWFCLSTVGPNRLSDPIEESNICLPIEPMFLAISARVRVTAEDTLEAYRQLNAEEQQKVLQRLGKRHG